jgi:hypothetical protein
VTIPSIDDIISSLITPYLTDELPGQLAGVEALEGLASADQYHSLQSWPAGEARYYLVYNEVSAVLFHNETLVGVAPFERKLLSKKHPEKTFTKPFVPVLAEGAL